jgi:hypothetical protein
MPVVIPVTFVFFVIWKGVDPDFLLVCPHGRET